MSDSHRAVDRLFRAQHGVAADRQIRASGLTWEEQRTMLRRGTWARLTPGVVRLVGAPATWHQRAMAAVLAPSGLAMLDGSSAARLHDLDGFRCAEEIFILVHRTAKVRQQPTVTVSWSRRLTTKDMHVVDGIPVTTVPITLIRLAALGQRPEQALDSALRKRASPRWLRDNFQRWQGPGVSGPAQMLQLLDERMGKRLPRSWFQRLAKRMLASSGATLVDEWPVRDQSGRLLAELDLAHVGLKVGVECQSIEYHDSPADRARDITRKRLLRRLGWDVVELWWSDLDRMDDVAIDLQIALDRAAGPNVTPSA